MNKRTSKKRASKKEAPRRNYAAGIKEGFWRNRETGIREDNACS